jgi:hypothetical protein
LPAGAGGGGFEQSSDATVGYPIPGGVGIQGSLTGALKFPLTFINVVLLPAVKNRGDGLNMVNGPVNVLKVEGRVRLSSKVLEVSVGGHAMSDFFPSLVEVIHE